MAMVLIIEDDDTIREMLRRFLTKIGHEVQAFGDAGSAMDSVDFSSVVPAVVVLEGGRSPLGCGVTPDTCAGVGAGVSEGAGAWGDSRCSATMLWAIGLASGSVEPNAAG